MGVLGVVVDLEDVADGVVGVGEVLEVAGVVGICALGVQGLQAEGLVVVAVRGRNGGAVGIGVFDLGALALLVVVDVRNVVDRVLVGGVLGADLDGLQEAGFVVDAVDF